MTNAAACRWHSIGTERTQLRVESDQEAVEFCETFEGASYTESMQNMIKKSWGFPPGERPSNYEEGQQVLLAHRQEGTLHRRFLGTESAADPPQPAIIVIIRGLYAVRDSESFLLLNPSHR